MMKKVLIVDPSEQSRSRLKSFLTDSYETLEATNERSALSLLSTDPDYILLATDTPESGGFELYNHLNIYMLKNTPKVIFLKSDQTDNNAPLNKLKNHQPIITKDCSKEDLLKIINPNQSAKKTVHILEPNVAYNNIIQYCLETVSTNAQQLESLSTLDNQSFAPNDLLLLDYHSLVHNDDNLDILHKFKSEHPTNPIILLIDHQLPMSSQEYLAIADEIIEKPFKEKEFILKVQQLSKPLNLPKVLVVSHVENLFEKKEFPTQEYQFIQANPQILKSDLNKEDIRLIILDFDTSPEDIDTYLKNTPSSEIPELILLSEKNLSPELIVHLRTRDFIFKPFTPFLFRTKIEKLINCADKQLSQESKTETPENIFTKEQEEIPKPSSIINKHKPPTNGSSRFVKNPKFKSDDNLINQLIVTINHQIRSPLTTILAGAQCLKVGLDNAKEQNLCKDIEESAKRISTILDDLENTTHFVVEEYLNDIAMLNINKKQDQNPNDSTD